MTAAAAATGGRYSARSSCKSTRSRYVDTFNNDADDSLSERELMPPPPARPKAAPAAYKIFTPQKAEGASPSPRACGLLHLSCLMRGTSMSACVPRSILMLPQYVMAATARSQPQTWSIETNIASDSASGCMCSTAQVPSDYEMPCQSYPCCVVVPCIRT